MTPKTLVRLAAVGALATAASEATDPDFAPLNAAQVMLGQTWPSQSPQPGQGALPAQLLIYGWDERSTSVSEKTTNPKFETVFTLVIEIRQEVLPAAAVAKLPAQPTQAQISAAIDGALEALTFAVKKAICQGMQASALALNVSLALDKAHAMVIEEIRSVETQVKLADTGQRMAGNAAMSFEIIYGEYFEPLIPNDLLEAVIIINPEAGSIPNGSNVGNGSVGTVTPLVGAQLGTYALLLTSPTAFTLTPPVGSALSGTVGAPFTGAGVAFTLTAGTRAFSAGDGFSVIVQGNEDLVNF